MYKTESVLGLIGSILGIISIVIVLIASLVIGALLSTSASYLNQAADQLKEAGVNVSDAVAAASVSVVAIIIGLIIAIAAVVLGFIGTGKLKKGDKKGGILLIVAGALVFITLFMGGIYSIVSMVLFLVGGIMAVAKKPAPQA